MNNKKETTHNKIELGLDNVY